jgi:hypothetical protein
MDFECEYRMPISAFRDRLIQIETREEIRNRITNLLQDNDYQEVSSLYIEEMVTEEYELQKKQFQIEETKRKQFQMFHELKIKHDNIKQFILQENKSFELYMNDIHICA